MTDPRAIELKLGAFRMIATLLGVITDALHDCEGFANSADARRLASSFAEREESLKTEIMPEVSAAIEGLEAEARQS